MNETDYILRPLKLVNKDRPNNPPFIMNGQTYNFSKLNLISEDGVEVKKATPILARKIKELESSDDLKEKIEQEELENQKLKEEMRMEMEKKREERRKKMKEKEEELAQERLNIQKEKRKEKRKKEMNWKN